MGMVTSLPRIAVGALLRPLRAWRHKCVIRIGFLSTTSLDSSDAKAIACAFQPEMLARRNSKRARIDIEIRSVGGDIDRLSELAQELVRLNVDIILTVTPIATRAAHKATTGTSILVAGFEPPLTKQSLLQTEWLPNLVILRRSDARIE
jgi:hypothetical protein